VVELIEVLDEQGNKTGRILPIQEVHDKKLWHGVAHVWIYNDKGEILLQKRDPTRRWAGDKWDLSAGGHISAGETPLQATIREAKEEIGLILNPDGLKFVEKCPQNNTQSTNRVHNAYEWDYIAKSDASIDKVKLQGGEAADAKWLPLDEFEKDINNPTTFQQYAPRDIRLYRLVISKIREELAKK
jgi:isopentenyl-diphosphate delta-isomerase